MDLCTAIFKYGAEVGYKFTVLDIGGGFAESEQVFKKVAVGVSEYIKEFTSKHEGITVIAEPGRK